MDGALEALGLVWEMDVGDGRMGEAGGCGAGRFVWDKRGVGENGGAGGGSVLWGRKRGRGNGAR